MEKPPVKVLPARKTGSACIRHQTKEKRNLHTCIYRKGATCSHTQDRSHSRSLKHIKTSGPTAAPSLRPWWKRTMWVVLIIWGGPRVKVRWSLGSRPERGATDLRTYTELEHELGLDHRSPTGRCHWPGWRKEVELLQFFPCLFCISGENVERDETWAGGTWVRDIANVPVRHSRTQLWSHLSCNHNAYF